MKKTYRKISLYLTMGIAFTFSGHGTTGAQPTTARDHGLSVETEFSLDSGKYGSDETISVYSGALTAEYELFPRWSFFLTVVPYLYQSETYTDVVLIKGKPVTHHDISGAHPHQPPTRSESTHETHDPVYHHPDTHPDTHHPEDRHDDEHHRTVDHHDHHDRLQPASADFPVELKTAKSQPSPSLNSAVVSPNEGITPIEKKIRGKGSTSGIGDTCIGASYRIVEEFASRPEMSLLASVKIPTADKEKGLGTGEIDYQVGIGASKDIGRWTVDGEVSYTLYGDPEEYNLDNTLSGSAGVATEILPGLETSFLVYGGQPASAESDSELALELGLSYDFDQFGVVSAFINRGLADGSPDWGIGIGYTFTF